MLQNVARVASGTYMLPPLLRALASLYVRRSSGEHHEVGGRAAVEHDLVC